MHGPKNVKLLRCRSQYISNACNTTETATSFLPMLWQVFSIGVWTSQSGLEVCCAKNKQTNKQTKVSFTGTERICVYLLNHLIPCGAAYKQIYLQVFTNHNQIKPHCAIG